MASQDSSCPICLQCGIWPKAKPKACEHTFCYECISEWMNRRSECPLCKSATNILTVINADGSQKEEQMKMRTADHFERELNSAENLEQQSNDIYDITVLYAKCLVCGKSDNEDLLMLCDGIVGEYPSGLPILCNAGCHCYCSPEKWKSLPSGNWYCSFCTNSQETVRNNRPVVARIDSDETGPSGFSSVRPRLMSNGIVSHRLNSRMSRTDDSDWSEQDRLVLDAINDTMHPSRGRTAVLRKRKRRSTKKRRLKSSVKKLKKLNTSKKLVRLARKRKWKHKKKLQAVKRSEKSEPIVMKNAKKKYPSDGIVRNSFGVPSLSITQESYFAIPNCDTDSVASNKKVDTAQTKVEIDLIDEIMVQQTKTLAPSRYLQISRNGEICWEQNDKHLNEKKSPVSIKSDAKYLMSSTINGGNVVKRKKRPSRWGTPTTSSIDSKSLTASIPLPSGPPIQSTNLVLDNIPIPTSLNTSVQMAHTSSPVKPALPTALTFNTAQANVPSFSLASSTASRQPHIDLAPFVNPSLCQQSLDLNQHHMIRFGQQQLAGLSHQALVGQQAVNTIGQMSVPHSSLMQMQHNSLMPNIFLPPINISAMNNLLTASILANSSHLTATSNHPSSLLMNPVQITAANQHLIGLNAAVNDQNAIHAPNFIRAPRLPEGVPPPSKSNLQTIMESDQREVSLSLGEKMQQLFNTIEAHQSIELSSDENPNKSMEQNDAGASVSSNAKVSGDPGRKSASAEDEETGDTARPSRIHKNAAMFEEARQMLSSSLKKVYRMKRITKAEYKEVMKRGVTALSQRSKLDQKKVDDYASKYVEYIHHRRKKNKK